MLKLSAYKVGVVIAVLALVLVAGYAVQAYQGASPKVVVEGDYLEAASEQEDVLGAVVGPNVYTDLLVHGRFLQGATMLADSATSTQAADTITAINVRTYSGVDYTPGNEAVSVTLPASSTLSFLKAGECIDWRWRNLDSDSNTSTTFVAGTGIDLVENENGDVVIEGGNEAQLKFCRELDTDVTVYVDEYIAAD